MSRLPPATCVPPCGSALVTFRRLPNAWPFRLLAYALSPTSPRGFQRELYEARERILDKTEEVLFEASFSDDPKRRDSVARYILTKSQTGRARLHALTEHLRPETNGGVVDIRWVE